MFGPGVIERLALIARGRAAGFSLDEIRAMIEPGDKPRIDRAMLAATADEIDRTIERLAEMRDGLRHAAACRAPSHMACPPFRRRLGSARCRDTESAAVSISLVPVTYHNQPTPTTNSQ